MTGAEGWRRTLTWVEAAELPVGRGALVYHWDIEPRMSNRRWNLGPGDWARATGLEAVSLIQLK